MRRWGRRRNGGGIEGRGEGVEGERGENGEKMLDLKIDNGTRSGTSRDCAGRRRALAASALPLRGHC